jgi:hypothetical protein
MPGLLDRDRSSLLATAAIDAQDILSKRCDEYEKGDDGASKRA